MTARWRAAPRAVLAGVMGAGVLGAAALAPAPARAEGPRLPEVVEYYLWCLTSGELCPLIDLLVCHGPLGVPGVVETKPDGDIWVAGTHVWDCVPYES